MRLAIITFTVALHVFFCVRMANGDTALHPWMMDAVPLTITEIEYRPPESLYSCPTVVADASGISHKTGNCLPTLTTQIESQEIVFDRTLLIKLQKINEEVNDVVPEVSLPSAIMAAVLKKEQLLSIGLPSSILSYAVVERPEPADEDVVFTDHIVLVVHSVKRAWVLDIAMHDVLPWHYSPHRFYGAEIEGQWRVVIDNRDDPLQIAIEWYEVVE